MDEDGRIDTALNRILRAAGSPVLRKYMPTTQDALRKAMREVMSAEYIAGSNACEAASEFLQRKLSVTDEAVDAALFAYQDAQAGGSPWQSNWMRAALEAALYASSNALINEPREASLRSVERPRSR